MSTLYSANESRLKPLFGININPMLMKQLKQAFELAKKGDDLGVDLLAFKTIPTTDHSLIHGL